MWYAVYETATGKLASVGTTVADPLPAGLTSVSVGADKPTGTWNESTLAFDAPVAQPTVLSRLAFLQRMTASERIAIRTAAKTDAVVEDFMDLLNLAEQVNVSHDATIAGVNYLVSQGLLTSARAAEILA